MKPDERFFPPSTPRPAKGGIKARTQRGAFGTRWWAQRWIAALEGLMGPARLQRGRRYARAGQVLDLAIAPGLITASVQGSRATPYRVTIRVTTLADATWRKIAAHITGEARFTAALLAGEMPDEIEVAFAAAGASLFPASERELRSDCSCPDSANPCKHIAATYYLVGEEFDNDPFLLFALRGATKSAILAELHDAEAAPAPGVGTEPLPLDFDAFWHRGPAADAAGELRPTSAVARPRALPPFPFWRGSEPLDDVLGRIDEAAVAAAVTILAELEERG